MACVTQVYVTVSIRFFFSCYASHRDLHSFPTRRSSDLFTLVAVLAPQPVVFWPAMFVTLFLLFVDRKSTRLNSSHQIISYAAFCLKKKQLVSAEAGQPPLAVGDRPGAGRIVGYGLRHHD